MFSTDLLAYLVGNVLTVLVEKGIFYSNAVILFVILFMTVLNRAPVLHKQELLLTQFSPSLCNAVQEPLHHGLLRLLHQPRPGAGGLRVRL